MKAIMYHYVRKFDRALPNFRFLDIANFKQQLDYFAKEYGFVERDEWSRFCATGKMPNQSGKVILTFDDAMKCHYDYVFPELKKRNLWGIFYVPSLPYTTNIILDVHRIHLLCGAFDGAELLRKSTEIVTADMIPFEKRDEFKKMNYKNQNNYTGVTEFKRIMNYYISYDFRSSILDEIAKSFAYQFDAAQYYISNAGLKEMNRAGMILGSHTHSHPVMSKLNFAEQESELVTSFNFIDEFNTPNERTYCHPYGGFHTFNNDTISLLNSLNVQYSFNVEAREINAQDHQQSRQFLPRYDCNLFPFGQAS